jgi:type I site-specific restriction-modification system R (restriction) subunit
MKIQWEYDLVEKPFCEQLQTMGWQWLEGDTDVPELTERGSFREVLLKERLTAALRKLNLHDGQPWLDDTRIARAIRDLEQAAGHRLMETNQSAQSCCSRVQSPMVCLTGSRVVISRCGSLISSTRQTTTSLSSTSSR